MNKIIYTGTVGKVDFKFVPSGDALVTISLAQNKYNPRTKVKSTQWLDVTAWGKVAERVNKVVKKGMVLLVEGSVKESIFKDKEGKERKDLQVVISNFEIMKWNEAQSAAKVERKKYPSVGYNSDPEEENTIPF